MVKWIVLVVALWLVSIAAVGYVAYTSGVNTGQTQAQNIRAQFLAERGQGTGGQGFGGANTGGQGAPGQAGGRQFNPANFVGGQVKQINGNTIQVSTANAVVNVKVGDRTQIQKMGQAQLSDIKPGDRITAQGTSGANGEFSAQMIQLGNTPFGGGNPQRGQAPAATPSP